MPDLDLSGIDWASLRHSGRSAADLPEYLQRIAGGEGADDAVTELSERICIQGVAVGAATSYVIPFLVKIAQFDRSLVRLEVLRLLRKISRASHAWRSAANNAAPEYRGNYTEKIAWEEAVDTSFRISLPGLVELAGDSDPEVVRIAGELLAVHDLD